MSGNLLLNNDNDTTTHNILNIKEHNQVNPTTICTSCLQSASETILSRNTNSVSERTPLLSSSSISFANRPGLTVWEKAWLAFFLLILICASSIGLYLLFTEDETSIPESFDFIPKTSWIWENSVQTSAKLNILHESIPLSLPVSKVLLTEINSTKCVGVPNCKKFLNSFKEEYGGDIPYNFIIDSAGHVYEGAGWFLQSKCRKVNFCDDVLSISFIGHFEAKPPTYQISSLRTFLSYSITKRYLDPCYEIELQMENYSRKKYLIDVAFKIQNFHREMNNCNSYL